MGGSNKSPRRGVGRRDDGTYTPGGGFRATVRLNQDELAALAARARRHELDGAGGAIGPALRHALRSCDRVLTWATAAPPAELGHALRAQLGVLLDEPELVADAVLLALLDAASGAIELGDVATVIGQPPDVYGRALAELRGEGLVPLGSQPAPLEPTADGLARLARLRALKA